jgi:hypothetical protein
MLRQFSIVCYLDFTVGGDLKNAGLVRLSLAAR